MTKRSRRGAWVLGILIAVVIAMPRVLDFFTPDFPVSINYLDRKTELLEYQIYRSEKRQAKQFESKFSSNKFKLPSRKFNPNEYGVDDWMALGMSEKQAISCANYIKKRGGIYTLEELNTIFTIPNQLKLLIADSLIFESKAEKSDKRISTANNHVKIELNTANLDNLVAVSGIGEFTAKKILTYRDQLGGFVSVNQLFEIKGLQAERIEKFIESLRVDPRLIKKIKINEVSADELKQHPYFSWNVSNSIVKYRSAHGSYRETQEIGKSALVDDQLLEKITPYIEIK